MSCNSLFLLLPALLLVQNAGAPEARRPIRPHKDFALFFAVQDYQYDSVWPDLKNPVRDARAIADSLKAIYGFEAEMHENPTKIQIQETLDAWQRKTFEADAQLFIFFTGHGEFNEISKKGFFIPKDGLASDKFGNSYISYPDLERDINAIGCRHILLGVDACYSGTFDADLAFKSRPDEFPPDDAAELRQRLIADRLTDQSRLLFTSGGKTRTPDGKDHSPLTERLLKVLGRGDADDGVLEFEELKVGLKKIEPMPHFSHFEGHQVDGNFLFIQNTTAPDEPEKPSTNLETTQPPAKTPVRETIAGNNIRLVYPGGRALINDKIHVYTDNREIGEGGVITGIELETKLPPGKHEIKLKTGRQTPDKFPVNIEAGKRYVFEFNYNKRKGYFELKISENKGG